VSLVAAWMFAGCSASDSCPPNFDPAAGATWHDTFYSAAAPLPASVHLAGRVAGAEPQRCSPQTAVVVHRIRGVDPRLLLAEVRPQRRLLIAPGFLPQLRGFPLRRALWHRAASMRRHERRCHGRRRFAGQVWGEPHPSDPVVGVRLRRGRFLFLVIAPDTKVDAPTVAGQPQILVKDRVTGSGRWCGRREVLVGRLRVTAS
jgi:hypothetical protein